MGKIYKFTPLEVAHGDSPEGEADVIPIARGIRDTRRQQLDLFGLPDEIENDDPEVFRQNLIQALGVIGCKEGSATRGADLDVVDDDETCDGEGFDNFLYWAQASPAQRKELDWKLKK